jgi:hypothetical protein
MMGGVGIYGVLVVIFAASSSLAVMASIGLCHVTSHALVPTVIQAYSPAEFRGGTMAIFHMTQVVLVVGAMLAGALSTNRAHRAATLKSIPGDSNDGRNLSLNAACARDTLEFTPLFATGQRAWAHRRLC